MTEQTEAARYIGSHDCPKMNDHHLQPNRPKTNPGPKISIAPEKSVVGEIKEGMRAFPDDQEKAAASIGVSLHVYRFLRKLISIQDRPYLSHEDRSKIQDCFEVVERERQLVRVRETGEDIIRRNWIKRKDPPYITNHRHKRFEKTIMNIRESCESTVDMKLPNEVDVFRALGSLSKSIDHITKLMRKLVGEPEE